MREVDTSTAEGQMNTDHSLSTKAEGFVYDLCLFDDHVKTGKKIKVMFQHLYMYIYLMKTIKKAWWLGQLCFYFANWTHV